MPKENVANLLTHQAPLEEKLGDWIVVIRLILDSLQRLIKEQNTNVNGEHTQGG